MNTLLDEKNKEEGETYAQENHSVVLTLQARTTFSRHTNTAKLGGLQLKYGGCDSARQII